MNPPNYRISPFAQRGASAPFARRGGMGQAPAPAPPPPVAPPPPLVETPARTSPVVPIVLAAGVVLAILGLSKI